MFTGIVEELGDVVAIDIADGETDARVTIDGPVVTGDARLGDSIAVDGVCLTVTALDGSRFTADLMAETLSRTAAGVWRPGSHVNLERSVTPATRLGGHLVQGHVDGVGTVTEYRRNDRYDDVAIAVPRTLGRFLAPQGAVAVDGISLTVIDVIDHGDDASSPGDATTTFTVGVIPATRAATTLGQRSAGDKVNIEVDVMAKYAERLLAARMPAHARGADTAGGSVTDAGRATPVNDRQTEGHQ